MSRAEDRRTARASRKPPVIQPADPLAGWCCDLCEAFGLPSQDFEMGPCITCGQIFATCWTEDHPGGMVVGPVVNNFAPGVEGVASNDECCPHCYERTA